MKTFVLTVSRYFPATHKRKGEPTCFVEKVLSEQISCGLISKDEVKKHEPFSMFVFNTDTAKIHTIRANYPLWAKRIEQIQKGEAILSIRYWSGKPYNSKQVEFCQLDKDSGIGIQSLQMTPLGWFVDSVDSDFTSKDFAKNDGLSLEDFYGWFREKISIDMEPMGIIHFTKFRY